MRVVITTGLFPPDVGGPATHASDLAAELRERGHEVTVLTVGDGATNEREASLVRYPRSRPWPVRTAEGIVWLVTHRRQYDLIYATGLPLVAVPGGRLARRPVVLKVVGDPAWERGRHYRLTSLGFAEFQQATRVPVRLRALRGARNWPIRRATAVVTPSRSLSEWVSRWAPGRPVAVVPNGVRVPEGLARNGAERGRTTSGGGPLRLAFAGRLVLDKRVDVVLDAMALVDGVTLEVLGDGPERDALRAHARQLGLEDRVAFTGRVAHDGILERLAHADALVIASSHEGLPHVVIEALACGTPIVSAAAEGLSEVVVDGTNGVVVEPMTAAGLAAALSRLRDAPEVLAGLREGALTTAAGWRFERSADRLLDLFSSVTGARPRAVFVGKSRIPERPPSQLVAKYAIHARHLDQVTICTGRAGVRSISGVRTMCFPALRPAFLGGVPFYALAPPLAVAIALARRPSAIVCQSPYEAAGVMVVRRLLPARMRPPVQVELHGDWRTGPRLYGSRLRKVLAPVSDRVCTWALRQASQVRAVSGFNEGLARSAGYDGPVERYITFSDFGEFLDRPVAPLPEKPVALFVGVFERYKAVDVLLDAWESVNARVPGARLVMVGTGRLGQQVRERALTPGLAASVEILDPVPHAELAELLDRSTCLVLPSRSEGLPRVTVEALARGRAVVATTVGGLEEVVEDGCNGRLVPPEDVLALGEALVDVLGDPDKARRFGAEGRRRAASRRPAEEYEAGITRLAAWIRG